MGYTELDLLRDEAKAWERMYESSNKRAGEWAGKCGELKTQLKYAEYRLEVARRKYFQLTGEYNIEWPELSGWETVQAFEENPKYAISISNNSKTNMVSNNSSNDILDLFKQSSK